MIQLQCYLYAWKASGEARVIRWRFLESGSVRLLGVPPASCHSWGPQVHQNQRVPHRLQGNGNYLAYLCFLEKKSEVNKASDGMYAYVKDYNATIEFYWAPFLVESNSDNAIVHRMKDRMVRGRSINKHARHWKGADIMVFNTYLWWMTGVKMKIL